MRSDAGLCIEADRREASAAWIVSMSGHEIPTAP
jgi:hypothetical protein